MIDIASQRLRRSRYKIKNQNSNPYENDMEEKLTDRAVQDEFSWRLQKGRLQESANPFKDLSSQMKQVI